MKLNSVADLQEKGGAKGAIAPSIGYDYALDKTDL